MIDPEVSRLARDRIGLRMEERRRRFPDVIRMVEETMAGRGLSQSSVRTNAIQNACDNEAALRLADS